MNEVKSDDRLRFSQMTTKVRIRRKRILPQQQILDLRNALYFLQGEPGIDRTRLGVWGAGLAADYALTIAATDARVKAVVADTPFLSGYNVPKKAFAHAGELLSAEQQRARTGQTPATRAGMEDETRLALAEYNPFWHVEQIPEKTAALFVVAKGDEARPNIAAATKLLKAPSKRLTASGDTRLEAATDWFLQHLK